MSELNNPLFDDQREFLERQKEEYKNALLSDVSELKDQSQKVGKNLLMAGGFLLGVFLVSKAFASGSDKPKKKKRGNRLENPARFKGAEDREWISSIPDVEDDEPLYSAIERTYPAVYHPTTGTVGAPYSQERSKGGGASSVLTAFFQSDLFKVLEQQLAAVLMVYLTKMIEQYTHQNRAAQPVLVEETTIDYQLQPDQPTDAHQPTQL
ncbi:hypothetical protein TH63_17395 [Rufibacter radiotolerans]|uniref:Uncharacterized protein n=1 Tax=Rufibacter radiotolerans TaxID=1379910 RepID=A0A0H4VNX8_9BACT|nr:hypothetical protein [Rufibacter radiotolerans]AKQ47013.1 hypothetical protein TH63_17395 [Rufibacter radiotolerans]